MIAPRKNYVKKSAAEKATAEVQKAMKKEKKAQLQDDINTFTAQRDKVAQELADKYNLKVEKTRQMLSNALVIKQKRRVNLWNALVSHRGRELNQGCGKGDRVPLAEIQEIVRKEIDEGTYDDVDEDNILEELEDTREIKTQGARSSNKAAALDYQAALSRIREEVRPNQQKTKTVDTMASLRSECVNLISGGLRMCIIIFQGFRQLNVSLEKIVGTKNITMSYERYDSEVVERYSVVLRGWPEGLQFRSPAKITTMEDARVLRDALVSGECVWVKLSRKEKEARAKTRQEKIASGEIPVKKRKKRSDAGKPRGPKKSKAGEKRHSREDDENNGEDSEREEPPQKRARKSSGRKSNATAKKLPPMPKSNRSINNDDDTDDNN
ncbi:hypothetical protein C0992_000146, partial [Termitomyces sp. T32_za158]